MAERLFVDLLFRSSRKYASWDPEVPVVVGDYGRLTEGPRGWKFWKKDSGTFLKEGNIYKEGTAEEFGIPEPIEHGATSTDAQTWVTSKNTSEVNFEGELSGQTPAFAQCKIRAAYKVTSGNAAVLVMDNATITTIDPPGKLRHLLDHPTLKGRIVVSEVHRCSSYARLLTAKGDGTIAIGLAVEPPAGALATANADARWVRSSSTGNFKSNISKSGERSFYPLFRLVSLAEGDVSTGMRGELDDDPPLPDAEPPWTDITSLTPDKNETATTSVWFVPRIPFTLPWFAR